MKYYIITIHCIPNFGSIFQTYGLVSFMNRYGYDAKVIDYRPSYYSRGRNLVRRYGAVLLNLFSYLRHKKKSEAFIRRFIPVTSATFHSFRELKKLPTKDIVYISGGDQLWNSFHPSGRDDAYKLTFVNDVRKLAFGTSMGRTSFSSDELATLADKVKNFEFIGLREQSTVELLKPYTSVPVCHVCDPVLLLNKRDYLEKCGEDPIIKEPYMLLYMTAKSEMLDRTVEYISQKYNLKVVHVNGFRKKCKCDYFIKAIGPDNLLNLIVHSRFVLSASFHATLFSILFEKQFCSFLPELGTNTRIEDLLSFFGLCDRIIHDETELDRIDNKIDYSTITEKVEVFSNHSREKLLEVLSSLK